jgi:hypothetical protein
MIFVEHRDNIGLPLKKGGIMNSIREAVSDELGIGNGLPRRKFALDNIIYA